MPSENRTPHLVYAAFKIENSLTPGVFAGPVLPDQSAGPKDFIKATSTSGGWPF